MKKPKSPKGLIRYHYDIAVSLALKEVEKEARKILFEHSRYKEFIMAMGSCFFTTAEKGETVDLLRQVYRNGGYSYELTYRYFGQLQKIFDEWNPYLKLTGEPMRFTATGKMIKDW